jgi:hypothetical protein
VILTLILASGNFGEAGHTILLHADVMKWDDELVDSVGIFPKYFFYPRFFFMKKYFLVYTVRFNQVLQIFFSSADVAPPISRKVLLFPGKRVLRTGY